MVFFGKDCTQFNQIRAVTGLISILSKISDLIFTFMSTHNIAHQDEHSLDRIHANVRQLIIMIYSRC